MKHILFTYYSRAVHSFFLENVKSLLANSKHTYTEIVICSGIEIPIQIIKELSSYSKVTRVYPDHNSQSAKTSSTLNARIVVNPFLLTAFSYKDSIITIFDSSLFVIKELPEFTGNNIFYKNHRGVLSTKLFTLLNSHARSELLVSNLKDCDFTSGVVDNKFTYLISNAIAFSGSTIYTKSLIFSNPKESDELKENLLLALDFYGVDIESELYDKMLNVRRSLVKKPQVSSKIRKSAEALVGSIKSSIKRLGDKDPIILYKYTSRSRPEQFYRGLTSIINNSRSSNYKILCSFDKDDPTLNQYLEYLSGVEEDKITICTGASKNKIDAINRDLNSYSENWDILVNMSDDMVFTKDGFDIIIKQAFNDNFPTFDGVVHYPDQDAGQKLMTMSILGKKYYQRFNYIYHPDYTSLWCDNEAMDVAIMLGKYKYFSARIFDHIHPAYGHCQTDEQYKHTESFFESDKAVYIKRKANNFKLDLAILIATVESRAPYFEQLTQHLRSQIEKGNHIGRCEVVHICDNKEISVGLKRHRLLQQANSEYVVFIDDDDWVNDEYVTKILDSIRLNRPDSIGFLIHCTFDGKNQCIAKASNVYSDWAENVDGFKYVRTPYHKTPVRRDIALAIGFKDMRYAEDHDYSRRLKESGLIKNEDFINENMYFYRYKTENHNSKYGISR